ncbi:MAG: hypothetical protein SH847_06955 [Roseiflexaceae bacterium]|nr:hypothetical protein [Roseiflexaceae bacterium]
MKNQPALIGACILLLGFLVMCGQPESGRGNAPQLSTPEPLITQLAVTPTVNVNDEGGITPIIGTRVMPPTIIPQTPDMYESSFEAGGIYAVQTQIADPNISEEFRATLRRLEASLRADAENRATAIAAGPKTPIFPTRQPTPPGGIDPTPDIPMGIIEFESTLFRVDESVLHCTDPMWQEVFGDLVIRVAACFTLSEPSDSYLLLTSFPFIQAPGRPYPKLLDAKVVIPGKVGPVRITAAQEHRFTLQANDGRTFVFDADTLQFVTSMTGTITPIATAINTPVTTTAPAVVATPAPAP